MNLFTPSFSPDSFGMAIPPSTFHSNFSPPEADPKAERQPLGDDVSYSEAGLEGSNTISNKARKASEAGGASKKKRKVTEEGDEKRKRQGQSCDACRSRKVKCDRLTILPPSNNEDAAARSFPPGHENACKHCTALLINCEFSYKPKKRGPPNLYVQKLEQEKAAKALASMEGPGGTGLELDERNSFTQPQLQRNLSSYTTVTVPSPDDASTSTSSNNNNGYPTPLTNNSFGNSSSLALPPFHPLHSSSEIGLFSLPSSPIYHHPSPERHMDFTSNGPARHQISNERESMPANSILNLGKSSLSGAPIPTFPEGAFQSQARISSEGGHAGGTGDTFSRAFAKGAGGKTYRLEDVLPRSKAMYIISLFFEFIWPLTPCLHQQSFLADVESRRETRDPLFFALLMSTLATTLVQVPRAFVKMDKGEVKRLAERCHWASRDASISEYDPVRLPLVVVRYFDCIYHFVAANSGVNHASFGEALNLALTLKLHDEDAYVGMDPIESESGRRIFWLISNADKSMAILLNRPIALRLEDITAGYPKELDDQYITRDRYLLPPSDHVSLISGFNINTKIWGKMEEILSLRRRDRRYPPVGLENIIAKLDSIRTLFMQTVDLISDMPAPLQIKMGFDSVANSPVQGWATLAKDSLESLFADPTSSGREQAKDAFSVSKGNIYVTQCLVRFVLMQYRDDLLDLCGEKGTANRKAGDAIAGKLDDRETISSDLLNILHSISIQALAVNGPSLVHKVRYVAATLLDADNADEEGSTNVVRFNTFLWDFLTILSEIETNFAVTE